jgi:hypothetical protein
VGLPEWVNAMKTEEGKAAVGAFLKQCQIICEIAKTAMKNKKSLSGDNFYGNKFHESIIKLFPFESQFKRFVASSDQKESEWPKFSSFIATLKIYHCQTRSTSGSTKAAPHDLPIRASTQYCKDDSEPGA